jgi:hypothetical protein
MTSGTLGPFNIDRVFLAIQKQRERLLRATRALDDGGVPYAVAGDHAVASWVSRIDEAAVRYPATIEIVLWREDLSAATAAVEPAGFQYRRAAEGDVFVDGPDGKLRDGVHVVFASEKVSPKHFATARDINESEPGVDFRVLSLDALVRLNLTTLRNGDAMQLRDMLDIGLIEAGWTERLPVELAARLQTLLANPDG